MEHDPYLLFADYQSYVDCQDRVSESYMDRDKWAKMSLLNTARMGKFSSDRAIREYCNRIWHAEPIKVSLEPEIQKNAGLKASSSNYG
jgi:starch phosphorylase